MPVRSHKDSFAEVWMLDRVTITGADDRTSIAEMSRLSEEFPFVEWGILVSKSREGGPRFPSRKWCLGLAVLDTQVDLLNLSMHVCGSWARVAFTGNLQWIDLPAVRSAAQRIQINGTPVQVARFPVADPWQQFIFQHPRSSGYLAAARDSHYDAVPLWDESGGEGVIRENWPAALPGMYNGYAGGIGPDNVVEIVGKIQAACDGPFWIDMEGRVRDSDDRLDMAKVRRVLELCAPFIDGPSPWRPLEEKPSEMCDQCGCALVHVAGNGVAAVACPQCDADSSALKEED